MKGTKSRKVYEKEEIKNFRNLLEIVETRYKDEIAYKYKEHPEEKNPKYVEKTFKQYVNDVKALSTSFLELGYEGKKIALIGNNSYKWCVTYMAVTIGGMIVVPLDKALPDNEIENLITRSKAEVVVFDKKYKNIMLKLKNDKNTNLTTLFCMDDIKKEGIEKFGELLKTGYSLLENGSTKYEKIKIDENKMSVLLFTSGTTSLPKGVMLSQKNICSQISNFSSWVKITPKDTLLSFLPIHHTFECTITFLYGMYSGATVAFCDGLKHIQSNMKEYKVSILVAVPLVLETMYKKIAKEIEKQGKTKLIEKVTKLANILLKLHIDIRRKLFKQILDNLGGNLRMVLYGAAPMNKDTIVAFNSFGVDLVQGYGLTETSPVISAETDKEKRPGSIGLIFDDIELKIDNPDKEGIGEILVKGPNVMLRIL